MLLKDNFYEVKSLQFIENTVSANVLIHSDHPIFKGHFPNNPVTPGVVEMEMVKEILCLALKQPVKMKRMSSCKFLAVLNPLATPLVDFTLQIVEQDENGIRINAQISTTETTFLKMSAEYSEPV